MKKLIFTACFAIFSSSFAWTQSKHLENANESFSQMAFKEAAQGYHRCLEKDPENTCTKKGQSIMVVLFFVCQI